MPGFNGTGPMGKGPMTGGARGYCNSGNAALQAGYGRRGFGRGRGYGRGARGAGGYPDVPPQYGTLGELNPADELRMLKAQATEMRSTLDRIQKRMSELEPKTEM